MTVNSTGDIITTGTFEDSVDFDPGIETFYMDSEGAFVSKISSDGEFLRADQYISSVNSYAFSVTTDNEDNILITGSFNGETDFALGAPVYNLYSDEGSNIFVTKLDAEFNFLWAKHMGSSELSNSGRVIEIDRENNVYTCGTFTGTADLDPSAGIDNHTNIGSEGVFVQVLTPGGDFSWAQSFGANGARTFARGMHLDPWDNILISGYFLGEIDVDPSDDSFLLNSSDGLGNYDIYYTKWGLPCSPTSSSIVETTCESYVSPSGNIFFESGIYEDTITNYGGCDSIISIDLSIKHSTFSSIEAIACDSYVTPSGTITHTESGTYMDTIPNFAGCDSIISINLTIEEPIDISITESGMTLTAAPGYTYQWVNCNNGYIPIDGETGENFSPELSGSYAVIISGDICSDTSVCTDLTIAGVEFYEENETLLLFPNPAKNWIEIQTIKSEIIAITVTDITGLHVLTKNNIEEPANEISLNISTLSQGYYLIQIKIEDRIITKKLEILR